MIKIAVIGECMIEYQEKKDLYKQSFGGDTFNCSVYLKRTLKKAHIEYITVVGEDELSKKMITFFQKQNIKTSYIDKVNDRNPGLYIINKKKKEKTVSYWRENSAASELFLTRSLNRITNELLDFDLIYFSAITLAIMSEEGRNNLFRVIKKARASGVKIAFDSRYKSKLYRSSDHARKMYNQAIHYCDIFLPSMRDEKKLWGTFDAYSVIERAKKAGCTEIVIKSLYEDITYYINDVTKQVETKIIKNIVDSTSAYDSFNGAYLASRLKGKMIEKSIKKAKKLQSKVILHQGAIVSKAKITNN